MYSYYVEQMNTLSELSQNLNLSIGYRNGRYYHHRRRYHQLFLVFVWFDSLCLINNLSVIKGRVFLGWTSTKLGLMFLLKDTRQWRRWGSNPLPLGLKSSTLPLSHCAPIRLFGVSSLPYSLLITFANSLDPDQFNLGPDRDPNCMTLWWYSWKKFSKKLTLK